MGHSPPARLGAYRFAPAAADETHVFGACSPGWHTTAEHAVAVEEWIDVMRDNEVERVCSLLPGGRDEDLDRYHEAFGPDGVRHAPIPESRQVHVETLADDVLPFLADAAAADERVVVHGLTGLGRTGYVLAAWLVRGRDYDPVDAVAAVEEMGRSPAAALDADDVRHGRLHRRLGEFA